MRMLVMNSLLVLQFTTTGSRLHSTDRFVFGSGKKKKNLFGEGHHTLIYPICMGLSHFNNTVNLIS